MADFYHIVFNCWWVLWDNSLQIVGSLFVSLAIFEYFYRKYRQKRIKKLENVLLKILQMVEYERDDAEHEFLAKEIKLLSKHFDDANELIKEQITISYKGILAKNDGEFYVLNKRMDASERRFDKFEEDTKEKITGALTDIKQLKETTEWITLIKRYKVALAALLSGIVGVNYYEKIVHWIKSLNIF